MRRSTERGMGAADLLGAIFVIGLAVAGGFAFMGRIGQTVSYGGAQVVATRLAQEVIERVTTEDFAAVGSSTSACSGVVERLSADGMRDAGASAGSFVFDRVCAVTAADDHRKVLLVTVSWPDAEGVRRVQVTGARLR